MARSRVVSGLFFVASMACLVAAVVPLLKGGSVNAVFLGVGAVNLVIRIALSKSAGGGNAPPA